MPTPNPAAITLDWGLTFHTVSRSRKGASVLAERSAPYCRCWEVGMPQGSEEFTWHPDDQQGHLAVDSQHWRGKGSTQAREGHGTQRLTETWICGVSLGDQQKYSPKMRTHRRETMGLSFSLKTSWRWGEWEVYRWFLTHLLLVNILGKIATEFCNSYIQREWRSCIKKMDSKRKQNLAGAGLKCWTPVDL